MKQLRNMLGSAWNTAALALLLSGCAPGLGSSIELVPIKTPEESSPVLRGQAASIHLQLRPFVDARPSSAVAEIKGREVLPSGDVAALVQSAFEARLKDAGVEISDPNAPIVGGQVEMWLVRVVPDFPASQASAEAVLTVEVSSLDNQSMYRGRYSGSTTIKHPLLNDMKIADALSQAMGYAIDEALKDERLLTKIARVYRPIY